MNTLNPKSKTLHFNIIEKTKNPEDCYKYLQDSIVNFSKFNKDEKLTFLERLISYGLHYYDLDSIMLEIKPIEKDDSNEVKASHTKGKITTQPYLFSNRRDLTDDITSVFHEIVHENIEKNINPNRFKSITNPNEHSKIMSFDPLFYDSQLNVPFYLKVCLIGNFLSPNSVTHHYKFARYFLNENEMMARSESMQFTSNLFNDCLNKLKQEPISLKNHALQRSILADISLINARSDNEVKYIEINQKLIDESQRYIKPTLEKFRNNALSSIEESAIYPALTHYQVLSSLQEGLDDESKEFFDNYYQTLIENNKSVYAIDLLNHPLYPSNKEQLIDCLTHDDVDYLSERLTNYNPEDVKLLVEEAKQIKDENQHSSNQYLNDCNTM